MKILVAYFIIVCVLSVSAMLPQSKNPMHNKSMAQAISDLRTNRNIVAMNLNLALQKRVLNQLQHKNLEVNLEEEDHAFAQRISFLSEQVGKLERSLDFLQSGINLIEEISFIVPLDKVTLQTTIKRFFELRKQAIKSIDPMYCKEIVVNFWKEMDK